MRDIFHLLFVIAVFLGSGALLYLWWRFSCFEWMPKSGQQRRLVSLIPLAFLLLWWWFSLDGLVVILHLVGFWVLSDLIVFCFPHDKRKARRRYYGGYLALGLTLVYLSYGYVSYRWVRETRYSLTTQKDLGVERLRIAMISDTHLGRAFNGKKLARHLRKIEMAKPDLLVIVGDFVDDGSQRRDWESALAVLAQFHPPMGKYYVLGNHDKGYRRHRDFVVDELIKASEKAGVRVLRDETISLNENIDLTGRRDFADWGRKAIAQLLPEERADHYRIVGDHQPADYEAEAAAGADLVLSGHTHGGQLWPLKYFMRWSRNNAVYGHQRRKGTDFIVTSGISNWMVSFKTACIAEYVLIDIQK